MMRKAELDEMRALLRAQAVAAPEPERRSLFGGVKSLLKKPAPKLPPLNLTPIHPPEPAAASSAALQPGPAPAPAPAEDAPMLFLAPKRARFGLADDGPRDTSEVRLQFRAPVEPLEPLDLQPRRRGASLAATEAAGVGPDEILELHEMLSERMPHLLEQIDLEAKLEQAPRAAPRSDEPSIADVVAAIEATRAKVERQAVTDAWADAAAALQRLQGAHGPTASARRRRLARVHADIATIHADLEGDLQAVRRARSRPMSRAA